MYCTRHACDDKTRYVIRAELKSIREKCYRIHFEIKNCIAAKKNGSGLENENGSVTTSKHKFTLYTASRAIS